MMSKQTCLPGLNPMPPTMRTPSVAHRIAERIVKEVNLDDFYWTPDELPERITDVAKEIVRVGRPGSVFSRLWKRQPPFNDDGERGGHPYGWEGIDEHCRHIAGEIAEEEVEAAVEKHRRNYGN